MLSLSALEIGSHLTTSRLARSSSIRTISTLGNRSRFLASNNRLGLGLQLHPGPSHSQTIGPCSYNLKAQKRLYSDQTSSRASGMAPQSVLIVGASRGLGQALVKHYAETIEPSKVFATTRGDAKDAKLPKGVRIIEKIDCSQPDCGEKVVEGLQGTAVQVVVYVAGVLTAEEFGNSKWDAEVMMYKVCAIAPVVIIEQLVKSASLTPEAKIAILTSEAGSVTLRTEEEGGGMFGHHGSKAAGNMIGRLLSFDLKDRGICIAMIHPGFLKTEMTKDAGLEKYYEKMGAVTPDEAAKPFTKFLEGMSLDQSGKLWAPMGGRGIGSIEEVLGKKAAETKTPMELPW